MFNLDETGLSDWKDSKPKPVLVPTDLADSMIHYPGNSPMRYQASPYCISTSEDACCPFLAPSEESMCQVLDMGIRNRIDFQIRIAHPRMLRIKQSSSTREVSLPRLSKPIEMSRDVKQNRQLSSVNAHLVSALMMCSKSWQTLGSC
jgi:hypothetical protein